MPARDLYFKFDNNQGSQVPVVKLETIKDGKIEHTPRVPFTISPTLKECACEIHTERGVL